MGIREAASLGVQGFYDALAPGYHLMFEDWEASIARQSAVLGPMLERECGKPATDIRVLDCACGIGTQLIGLAASGFQITGSDLSPAAVDRTRLELASRGFIAPVLVADLRDLASAIPDTGFDAVVCMDNVLPHLDGEDQLLAAATQIHGRLRPGGVFLASTRDYDKIIEGRPTVQGPAFYSDPDGTRRIVMQAWDWLDERSYQFHLFVTRSTDGGGGWETHHDVATYHCLRREELSAILRRAEFHDVRWLMPDESGFYQPIVAARRSG